MPDAVFVALGFLEDFASVALVIVALLIARGFIPIIARPDGSPVWHLSMAVMSLEIGIAMRAFYWSVWPQEWRAILGREPPNIIFGVILVYGGYHMLKVLLKIIPPEERKNYNLLTAPFYPRRWREQLERLLRTVVRRKD